MAWQFRRKTESKAWLWNDCLLCFFMTLQTASMWDPQSTQSRDICRERMLGSSRHGDRRWLSRSLPKLEVFCVAKIDDLIIWLIDFERSSCIRKSAWMSGHRILLVLPGNPATGSVKGSKKTWKVWMFEKQILPGYYTSQQICACHWGPPSYTFFLNDSCLEVHRSTTASVPQNNFCGPPFYPADTMDKLVSQGFTNKHLYCISNSTRTTICAWNVLTFVIMTIRKLQIYLAYAYMQNHVQHKTFHTNIHMFCITLCTSLQMFCFRTPFEFAQHFEATRPAKCAVQYEQQSQRAIHENCKPMATRRFFFWIKLVTKCES